MNDDHARLLKSVLEHPYQPDVCFVCGVPLTDENQTAEHIFPKWLQDRFQLWGQVLTLANTTGIQYEKLTIPCCFNCNNNLLSPLESRISAAVADGFDAVSKLPRFDLFRWLAKIYLGIQYKELSLAMDRRDPMAGSILTPEFVRRYAILHLWLQMSASEEHPDYTPGSLWLFPCQVPTPVELQFDMRDDASNGFMGIRMGPVAIMADFLENGVHEKIAASITEAVSKILLHPMQFIELVAMYAYAASLIGQETQIQFFEHERKLSFAFVWRSTADGTSPFVREWNPAEFAEVLSFYSGTPADQIYFPPNMLKTFLRDPHGNYVYWPLGSRFPFEGM